MTQLVLLTAVLLGSQSAESKRVAGWVTLLKDDEAQFRVMGAKELSKLGPKAHEAIPDLIAILGDERAGEITSAIIDRTVQHFVIQTLVSIGGKAIPAVSDAMLKNPDKSILAGAASALLNFVSKNKIDDKVVKSFQTALNDTEERVRIHAMRGIAAAGKKAEHLIPALIQLIEKDGESRIRTEAVFALSQVDVQGSKAIPVLTTALRDEDPSVRATSASALASFGKKASSSVSEIVKLLTDTSHVSILIADVFWPRPVWKVTAEALGDIGFSARSALPKLNSMRRQGKTVEMRVTAAAAVLRIEPQHKEALPSIVRELRGRDAKSALEALQSLESQATPALPEVLKLLEHKDAAIRFDTASTLGAIGDKSAIPHLRKAVEDSDAGVRHAATEALQAIEELPDR
jgi:HEAT repeat protein